MDCIIILLEFILFKFGSFRYDFISIIIISILNKIIFIINSIVIVSNNFQFIVILIINIIYNLTIHIILLIHLFLGKHILIIRNQILINLNEAGPVFWILLQTQLNNFYNFPVVFIIQSLNLNLYKFIIVLLMVNR